MNKKTIFLILIIASFLSVMAISIVGKNGDPAGVINAESIAFFDENNEEITKIAEDSMTNDKEVVISVTEEMEHLDYYFSVVINPENSTNLGMTVRIQLGKIGSLQELDENKEPFELLDGETHTNKYYFCASFDKDDFVLTKIQFTYNIGERGTHKQDYLRFIFDEHNNDEI